MAKSVLSWLPPFIAFILFVIGFLTPQFAIQEIRAADAMATADLINGKFPPSSPDRNIQQELGTNLNFNIKVNAGFTGAEGIQDPLTSKHLGTYKSEEYWKRAFMFGITGLFDNLFSPRPSAN